ncbi:MAG TPA: nitrate reductase molybdenum cofactor assembly chaperone [Methylophilus sp.]|nr:nitrate reductase molybdenum cofactor assembly chaperone [Methylophilus sp.]HQQ33980.1 nitrate reductase molybdenum cofactor assembly chaperone [Methylophilus sp.]
MQVYKLLSVLLEYPDQELVTHIPELQDFTANNVEADAAEQKALQRFLQYLQETDLTSLQADYVKTFDMTAENSLHLTHHLFGDDKNRGPALIDLGELYKDYGVEVATNELPDYLPLILEFTAYLDDSEATVFLSDAKKVLGVLTENLTKADSPYAALLSIVESRATLTKLAA